MAFSFFQKIGRAIAGRSRVDDDTLDAIEEALKAEGIKAEVKEMKHLGFFRVEYEGGIFAQRKNVGIVGGPLFKDEKICGGAMEADGDLEERFVLSAEDAQGARAVRERFEEIRPALFQVRVGGEWYWVDRCWADGKGMSVFGGRPVPEVTVTYPGRFETQWEVRRDQITEARVLLCRSILHDLFDI